MGAHKSVCIGAVAAPLHEVNPRCSTVGNYTYPHARNFGVNHGHNAIYYTSAQRTSAGKFANSKVGLPYNDKCYSNRLVNASSYNCSQLV